MTHSALSFFTTPQLFSSYNKALNGKHIYAHFYGSFVKLYGFANLSFLINLF